LITISGHKLSDEVAKGTLNSVLKQAGLKTNNHEKISDHHRKNQYRLQCIRAPDLPGCIATGKTKKQAEHYIYEAIQFHLEGMKESNLPIPLNQTEAGHVFVPM
jgi:predicted RNase H-like HicB family nuclease